MAAAWVGPTKARRFLSDQDFSVFTQAEASRFAGADAEAGSGPGRVTLIEPDLPEGLRSTPSVRPWLFVHGRPCALEKPKVSIVGTRSATSYGRAVAAKFGEAVARAGAAVVSGGAPGIDSAAHEGSLKHPDASVCVLPCGADRDYPARHRQLLSEIRSNGCTVSQYAWGSPCLPKNTAERDGLIAALGQAVVVIEAPDGSGSLITAAEARRLGRPVFVVPGPVTSPTFVGSHRLVREGAELVWEPGQVLDSLGLEASGSASREEEDPAWSEVLARLRGGPLRADQLAEELEWAPSDVLAVLTEMEVADKVRSGPDGYSLT